MPLCIYIFFFFNDTATTEIYTLSLHDALPIYTRGESLTLKAVIESASAWLTDSGVQNAEGGPAVLGGFNCWYDRETRSEEHTSELQSRRDLVCRLLLEKKKIKICE